MLTFHRGCALALLLLTTVLAVRTASASVDAVISGTVSDSLMHPLPGATVVLHDSAGNTVKEATTGPDGTYQFPGVSFGDYTVEASSQGLISDHQHVQIGSSEIKTIDLMLVNSEEVVEISEDWSVPAPSPATGSVATINRDQLAELPGAEARPVTEVIATQPGFVVDALGNVYVRGNHANIQYQVDGIPVPDSVGSMFAASIPVRLIDALEIYTGGMPAEFGNRLGAVVNLVTRHGGDHPEGNAQLRYGSFDTVEPGFAYSTRAGRTGVFIGGSYLYSQRALDPPSIDPILHDTGSTGRVFSRIDYAPCEANRYELFVTYAHNRFQIPIDPSVGPLDPARPDLIRPVDQFGNDAPAFVPHDTNARETEDELFAAASWTHTLQNNHGQIQLAPLYKLSRGVLFADARHALGATADPQTTASDVSREAHHLGGIAAYSLHRGNHLFKAGAQTDLLLGSTQFTSYARDDVMGGIDPSMTSSGHDHTRAVASGVYAQDRWTRGKLVLDLGLRADQLHVILGDGSTDDEIGVSPRAGLSYEIAKDTVAHVFSGVLWQPPAPLDAANAARALGVVPAGQPIAYDLKPESDVFSELGVASKLAKAVRGGLTAWGRYAWNQLDDTAVGSTSLLSNYNFRRGRAFGVEASLDVRIGPWFSAFANGSYGLAEGRGISSAKYLFSAEDLASDGWQTLDHAQTLTANAGATVRDHRFSVTSLVSYGSGLRTGPANDQHVPQHVRADVSMQYTFEPHGYPVRLGVDVFNLFDAHYAYRIANGFVGSSYAPARSVYLTLSIPLAAEPHHKGE